MISFVLAITHTQQQYDIVAAAEGGDVIVRAIKQEKELLTQFLVKEEGGSAGVVASVSSGLGFESAANTPTGIVLTGKTFTAQIEVPKSGGVFSVAIKAKAGKNSLKEARFGVALSEKATFSFPSHGRLVTHDQFLDPVGLVQGDEYGAAVMPDVTDLGTNRPMNPTLQVTGATVSYGFVPYDRDAEWNAKRTDRDLDNPSEFSWKLDLLISKAEGTVDAANAHLWSKYGAERALSPLPQTIPFRYYTKPAYDMQANLDDPVIQGVPPENRKGMWWIDPATKTRAPLSTDHLAKLGLDGNIVRFAWGLRWWAEQLHQLPWIDNADEVVKLAATAPSNPSVTPVAFDLMTKKWRTVPFEASTTAYNARWTLKYIEEFASPSQESLTNYVQQSADAVMKAPANGTTALFLQELAQTNAKLDSNLKGRAAAFVRDNRAHLKSLAKSVADTMGDPNIETVSLALVLAKLGEPEAKLLLSRHFLRQAVSKPSTVAGTEAFGALTGEHFSDEGQSNYSADLFECAILIGEEQGVQRSISVLRAPLALHNHQAHTLGGMFYPDEVGYGRSAAWFGHNGQATYGPWRGIAEGHGQTLASLADVYRRYGSLYTHKLGWTIGIDGIRVVDGKLYNGFSTNPVAFDGVYPFDHVDASIDERTSLRDPEHYPAVRTLTLGYDDGKVNVLALLGFSVLDARGNLSGTFTFGDGSKRPAEFLPTGLGVQVTPELLAKGPVTFNGAYKSFELKHGATYLRVGPPAANVAWPAGWRRMLGLSDVIATSVSHESQPVLSTADNGRKARDKSLTGVIESVPFLLTQTALAFTLLGDQGDGLTVELIDPSTNVAVASDTKDLDGPEDVVWELFEHVGRVFVFRIKDTSKTGSIEVKGLRMAKAGPN